jgi:prepilin-type N-terminal cleavage/methylation domain-containing protein
LLKPGWRQADPSRVDSRVRDRERPRAASERGFTLIEILVAALIVLIISAGVAEALISATDYTGRERNQSQASEVAQQDQERMKSMTDSQLTSLHQTRYVTLNNTQFTVNSTATFLNANGASSCSNGVTAYFKLTSTVTSATTPGNAGQSFTEETIITRPLGGSMVVPVVDQTGTALSGVAIGVAGQNTHYNAAGTTDANGCVAFAGLPTDSYTITASDPGYVDPNGNTTPSETASITQTGVTNATKFVMGPAGAIQVGFRTVGANGEVYDDIPGVNNAPADGTAPAGYELSYYGNEGGSKMTSAACLLATGTCTGSGTSPVSFVAPSSAASYMITANNLFPFNTINPTNYSNNYQVWAGPCEQEQPATPVSGTGSATGFATVLPGQALPPGSPTPPDVTVDEPAIDVAVKYNGTVYVPAHVDILFTGKNTSGTTTCTDQWNRVPFVGQETVGGTTYETYPAPFASTVAKGNPGASQTGDPGTLSVCVDYSGSHGSYYEWSPASPGFTNNNFAAATPAPLMDVYKNGIAGSCP